MDNGTVKMIRISSWCGTRAHPTYFPQLCYLSMDNGTRCCRARMQDPTYAKPFSRLGDGEWRNNNGTRHATSSWCSMCYRDSTTDGGSVAMAMENGEGSLAPGSSCLGPHHQRCAYLPSNGEKDNGQWSQWRKQRSLERYTVIYKGGSWL